MIRHSLSVQADQLLLLHQALLAHPEQMTEVYSIVENKWGNNLELCVITFITLVRAVFSAPVWWEKIRNGELC